MTANPELEAGMAGSLQDSWDQSISSKEMRDQGLCVKSSAVLVTRVGSRSESKVAARLKKRLDTGKHQNVSAWK